MQPCELVMFVSSLACCIAQDRSSDELALLASIFSQLGDSLATIAAQQDICSDLNDEKDTS
ncbi:MAG TPA: hypothetical protein DEQ64_09710 [Lachnoclostridium sp.]|jgi:hypothetical protein|uniref:DUF6774 domain-containing protein n=1 Tax=Lacrimispora sp. TaxID=2719234 RepID=UPI000EC2277F|nr:DUF6774 domain-containing protein [Lacrimispora sp.]HCD43992.1 hypothetical protein [Lachnoclostridium sp.]